MQQQRTMLYVIHLRACGDNGQRSARVLTTMDSSPRVRGQQARTSDRRDDDGFIPACAGTTTRRYAVGYADPDSSPRMRGQLGLE